MLPKKTLLVFGRQNKEKNFLQLRLCIAGREPHFHLAHPPFPAQAKKTMILTLSPAKTSCSWRLELHRQIKGFEKSNNSWQGCILTTKLLNKGELG